jgi:hypothetical protein
LTDLRQIISELELMKAAIDKALAALREIDMPVPQEQPAAGVRSRNARPGISPSGRQRIAEGMRQRWAAKRAAQKTAASKKVTSKRRKKQASAKKTRSQKKSDSKNTTGQS